MDFFCCCISDTYSWSLTKAQGATSPPPPPPPPPPHQSLPPTSSTFGIFAQGKTIFSSHNQRNSWSNVSYLTVFSNEATYIWRRNKGRIFSCRNKYHRNAGEARRLFRNRLVILVVVFMSICFCFLNYYCLCIFCFSLLCAGSATMLSEVFHSLADIANQTLLAIGIARSK